MCRWVYACIKLIITDNEAEYQSDAGSTKDTPYIYGVPFVNICQKIDRVITALHYVYMYVC